MQKVVLITIFMISYVIGNNLNEHPYRNLELIQDMSSMCVDNMQLNIFLPYGMGVADAVVILMSSKEKYPNCLISLNRLETKNDLFIIVVIEFSESKEKHADGCEHTATEIIIKDEFNEKTDVCAEMKKDNEDDVIFYTTSKSPKVSIQFKSINVLPTIKLTATAARIPPLDFHCYSESEISCLIGNLTLCISIELLCDKNINCGVIGSNDEDVRICDSRRYYKLWIVVSCSLLMLLIVAAFLIHLFKIYVPSVPDNFFIFNEDEDNKLILASKYIAPQECDLQNSKLKKLPLDPSLPSTSKEEQEPSPLLSAQKLVGIEDQIDIELLKAELRKEIEKEISRAIMQEYRPRFDSNEFIAIMDHIDPPNKSDQDGS